MKDFGKNKVNLSQSNSQLFNDYLIVSCFSRDVRKFIFAQFILESSNFSSHLFKTCNNFIGMKIPRCRITTGYVGDSVDFLCYENLQACLIDYVIWIKYNLIPYPLEHVKRVMNDPVVFSDFLRLSKYCPSPDYINRIIRVLQSYDFRFV